MLPIITGVRPEIRLLSFSTPYPTAVIPNKNCNAHKNKKRLSTGLCCALFIATIQTRMLMGMIRSANPPAINAGVKGGVSSGSKRDMDTSEKRLQQSVTMGAEALRGQRPGEP
jgi:hypothetical protein